MSHKYVDMHCDTLMKAYLGHIPTMKSMPEAMVDVERMKKGNALAQFFAIFLLPPGAEKFMKLDKPVDDEEYIAGCVKVFNDTMAACSDVIAPARNLADILANDKAGKMSGILAIEDGRSVQGDLKNIDRYYDLGVRYISLTWNHPNCFGFPNSKDPEAMAKGLTDFGKEAVKYMQQKGILVDVSHLSDGGFWDVVKLCDKPFVATHSNLRALCPHQRCMTDDMFKALADKGGVSGINFGPEFLNRDVTCKDSTVALMSEHIRRMINVGGEDAVAIGSDLDGIGGNLEIGSCDKMGLLFDQLAKDGLSEDTIEKIANKNVLRVIGEAVK